MAQINFLGGVKRMFHHIKVLRDGHEEYEPAMFIYREELKGRSFCVPLSSFWKYIEPENNRDVINWDRTEFDNMARGVHLKMMVTPSFSPLRQELANDAAGIVFAEALNEGSGVLLCTAFSLFKACHALDLTVGTQTLVQLMLFIQDGLDELKNMPPAEEENRQTTGEAVIRIDGKTYYVPVETTETDQARDKLED